MLGTIVNTLAIIVGSLLGTALKGGVLIMAIGINLLEIKKIRIGNMVPAIFIPFFYFIIKKLLS